MRIPETLSRWLLALQIALAALLLGAATAAANGRAPDALPTVRISALPEPARATLLLIEHGGPYPYRKDGTVFGNRERLLPERPRGYYREYTVPTPGERDRGARRIIAGGQGERYYTADHYRSFRRIVP
jgi:ribonuclease T1